MASSESDRPNDRSRSAAGDAREQIRAEAQRIHDDAAQVAQAQFEYAKSWRSLDRWLGSLAALLAAGAGATGLSELSATGAGLVALIAAGVGALATSIGARDVRARATGSACGFLALEQDARIFLNIDIAAVSSSEARERLQQLVGRHQKLHAESEIPSSRAWNRAEEELKSRRRARR